MGKIHKITNPPNLQVIPPKFEYLRLIFHELTYVNSNLTTSRLPVKGTVYTALRNSKKNTHPSEIARQVVKPKLEPNMGKSTKYLLQNSDLPSTWWCMSLCQRTNKFVRFTYNPRTSARTARKQIHYNTVLQDADKQW
jgi:hypothetical protein